jgi:hypothetical protein
MGSSGVTFWGYTQIASLAIELLSMFVILAIAFPKVSEVEKRIGTPGKLIDSVRVVYGGGPIGRWMRSMHVFAFFAYRQILKFGPRIAARYGEEIEPLPVRLKLWATLPHIVFLTSGIVFFSVGLSVDFD